MEKSVPGVQKGLPLHWTDRAAESVSALQTRGGGIVLGVDMSRRIIYIGDIDIFSANNSNSGINNSKGTINSNASKLIANLFAWVVGVVQ